MPLNIPSVASIAPHSQSIRDNANDTPARVAKAASDFEALLIGQMLKSAREAGESDEEEKDPNSTMLEFGEQQFAQVLASNGGFGMANMVVAGLTKHANR